jgi:Holliday junction DNA helicase RuvA
MIGWLRGELIESKPPQLILNVNGVGYEMSAPMSTFYTLPELGGLTTLYIHQVVREDANLLYGFNSSRDKSLFQLLIKANGVGPKLALAIMSGIGTDELVHCIDSGDAATLVQIPGIGKKTAERLLIELGDRLQRWSYASVAPDQSLLDSVGAAQNLRVDSSQEKASSAAELRQVRWDAERALESLGYKPQDAQKAVKSVLTSCEENEKLANREWLIRSALKSMVKKTLTV